MELKSIENSTNVTLQKLNEEYQTILKVQISFSYVAIIVFVFIILTIVSIDLCRLYSFLKLNKNNGENNNLKKTDKNIEIKTVENPKQLCSNDELKIKTKQFMPTLETIKERNIKSGNKDL